MSAAAVTVCWTAWTGEDNRLRAAQHRAGLSLLRRGLEGLYGISISQEELPGRLSRGEHGKPYLPDLPGVHFNISHCLGTAVCAFAPAPVGADVELPRPFYPRLPQRVLAPEELALWERCAGEEVRRELFFRLWTLKESFLKCSGDGISRPLRAVSFQFPGWPDTADIRCSQPGAHFCQRRLPGGQIFSLCCLPPLEPAEAELIFLPASSDTSL